MLKKSNYIISFFILIFAFQLNVFANVYYVDQSHVSANDGNVGSEEAPWATIMKAAATAQAGDTVFVKSGIYYDRIVFKNSGNDSAYITLKAYPNQTPEINGRDHAQWDGLINFSGVNYIRFEGFTVTNCSVGQAIYIINNGTSWATHIELKDLTISHIDDSGVQIRGNTSDVLIENCTAHDFNTASAFDASGYNGGRPNNITFRGNTVYNSSFAAVGSEMADDLLVENNNVSNCDIGLDIGSGKRNIIHNNSVVNCGDGIVLSSNSDSRV